MTTVTTIAQRILDENNYTTPTTTITEYLIKNAVDYINMMAGTSISFTPAAGAASLTADDDEIVVTKSLSVLLLRAYHDRGPNAGIGGLSVTSLVGDPQYSVYLKMIDAGIAQLCGRSFKRA
jgi:hypothetical protein